jgi:hypothetical protein
MVANILLILGVDSSLIITITNELSLLDALPNLVAKIVHEIVAKEDFTNRLWQHVLLLSVQDFRVIARRVP